MSRSLISSNLSSKSIRTTTGMESTEEFDTSHCGQATAVTRINSILDGDHLFSGNIISTVSSSTTLRLACKGICNSKGGINKHAVCSGMGNRFCNKKHSQLIRFDRICAVCVGRSPNGNFVTTTKLFDKEGTQEYHVYNFKDSSYISIFEENKKTRVAVFCNYEV